jgi:hypothetical protein
MGILVAVILSFVRLIVDVGWRASRPVQGLGNVAEGFGGIDLQHD